MRSSQYEVASRLLDALSVRAEVPVDVITDPETNPRSRRVTYLRYVALRLLVEELRFSAVEAAEVFDVDRSIVYQAGRHLQRSVDVEITEIERDVRVFARELAAGVSKGLTDRFAVLSGGYIPTSSNASWNIPAPKGTA